MKMIKDFPSLWDPFKVHQILMVWFPACDFIDLQEWIICPNLPI